MSGLKHLVCDGCEHVATAAVHAASMWHGSRCCCCCRHQLLLSSLTLSAVFVPWICLCVPTLMNSLSWAYLALAAGNQTFIPNHIQLSHSVQGAIHSYFENSMTLASAAQLQPSLSITLFQWCYHTSLLPQSAHPHHQQPAMHHWRRMWVTLAGKHSFSIMISVAIWSIFDVIPFVSQGQPYLCSLTVENCEHISDLSLSCAADCRWSKCSAAFFDNLMTRDLWW